MQRFGLVRELVDPDVHARTVGRFREARIALPTFAQLTDPGLIPRGVREALAGIDPDAAHPLNLFRIHWFNDHRRTGLAAVPQHIVLPPSLTGVESPIVVALGDRFPLIRAHKVLAAYGCLAPQLATGRFDPTRQRAIWPSTGNYCRGGVAISRLMGCRGVAVLPEGMSRERFEWLEAWVTDRSDIVRTPGSESNVKEIYDECARLSADPDNVVFNQFSEFANHLIHYYATGAALERVFRAMADMNPRLRLCAFTAATGSAGTIAAGDYLKERFGSKVVAVEALECATMLYNGFGEHHIQGIGDRHVPLIHNIMNVDLVVAVSDRATDRLDLLFNTAEGLAYLARRRGVDTSLLEALSSLGLSSLCNVLAAIKAAKYFGCGPDDAVVAVATDGAAMYTSERALTLAEYFPRGFDEVAAGEVFGEHILGATTDHLLEPTLIERERIFNLGYFTWVEQQGVSVDDFCARKKPEFWTAMREIVPVWDGMIDELNARTGVLDQL